MAPSIELGDVGFPAEVDVVVHLAVIEAFSDKVAHAQGCRWIAGPNILAIASAADGTRRKDQRGCEQGVGILT